LLGYFLLGVALGSIPIGVLFFPRPSPPLCSDGAPSGIACTPVHQAQGNLACLYGVLYLVQLVLTIRLLWMRGERRYIGWGLLTLLLAGPVVAAYACNQVTTPSPA
jgi:hypothetical protein